MRHQKENSKAGADGRAPQSAAGQSGLQFDRASAHQDDTRESQSGSSARGKNGHARQEEFFARATHRARGVAAKRCRAKNFSPTSRRATPSARVDTPGLSSSANARAMLRAWPSSNGWTHRKLRMKSQLKQRARKKGGKIFRRRRARSETFAQIEEERAVREEITR